jgi:hypothetical protein
VTRVLSWGAGYGEDVEHREPILFPHAAEPSDEELEAALAEVDAAIELVERGAAVRIRLIGFALADAIAGLAAAHAQLAGVTFQLDRSDVAASLAIIVGPLI